MSAAPKPGSLQGPAADTGPTVALRLATATPSVQLGQLHEPLAPLDAALLAWLALEGPTPRARLAQLLWPRRSADAARNSLRQRLFQLRRTLGHELVQGPVTAALADGVTHDLADADEVLGDLVARDIAAGEFAVWLDAQRSQRRERLRLSLAELADMAEAVRDWDDALAHARELLAIDPLSELAHGRLIRLHYLSGDRAAALQAFDRCEQMLKHELGARPSAATLALLALLDTAAPTAPPQAQRAVPLAVQRPPRLVGRDAAWAALHAAWAAGTPTLVRGDAGLGKTRLVTDFARSREARLLAGARPGDQRVPYASASRLLRQVPRAAFEPLGASVRAELARLLPELGASSGIGTPAERTRFLNAVVTLLDSPDLGLEGVVFDDLQFADDASVELLQYVAAHSSRRWLFAARGAELGDAAQALLRALGDGLMTQELQPLSLPQIAELLASLQLEGLDADRAAPTLLRHTGGNPLFLLETLKSWLTQGALPGGEESPGADLWASLPAAPGVAALIERRIGQLSPPALRLVRCAAVAAPDFSVELAAQVLQAQALDLADAWAELVRAQLLREDGAFAHDLIYDSALASVPPAVARHLHGEVARCLGVGGGEPARRAQHWLQAGRDDDALTALCEAAEQARRALRKRDEIALREQASAIAERLGRPDEAFDLALAQFEAQMVADRTPLGEAFFQRLDRLAQAPGQQLRALLAQADFLMSTGRLADAAPRAERAAGLAREQGDTVREIEALRCAAACASYGGDSLRAVGLLQPALARAEDPALDDSDRCSFFADLACCLDNAAQAQQAQPHHQRALALALQARRLDQAAVVSANTSHNLKSTGRVLAALESAQQARRHALALDEASGATYNLDTMLLALLRDLSRYDEALQAGDAALASMHQNPSRAPVVHGHMAWLWLQLGQHDRAEKALQAAAAGPVAPPLQARVSQLQGRLLLARQQADAAARAFEQAQAQAPQTGRLLQQALVALDHARCLAPAEALRRCEQVAQQCRAVGYEGAALSAHLRAADFALAAGDVAAARVHAQALQDAPPEILADDVYPAERWWVLSRVFAAAGDAGAQRAAWAAGRDWVLHTSRVRVPAEFQPGFLADNAVNRALLSPELGG